MNVYHVVIFYFYLKKLQEDSKMFIVGVGGSGLERGGGGVIRNYLHSSTIKMSYPIEYRGLLFYCNCHL